MTSANLIVRVWDKRKQELFIAHSLKFDRITGQLENVLGYDNPDSFKWRCHGGPNLTAKEERFILMLWSGYNDVNRNMIFPEDIVQFGGMTTTRGTVKFKHGKFVVKTKDNEIDLCDAIKFKNMIIISNTFKVPGAMPISEGQ